MARNYEDWQWVRREMLAKGEAIATSLRSGVTESSTVPNLDWNVGRLAAHIVSIPQMYNRMQVSGVALPDPANPAAVQVFSDENAAMTGSTDPAALGAMLVPEIEALHDLLGDDGDAPAQWYQHELTARQVGGIAMSELLLHHVDLTGATGENRAVSRITSDQACAAFEGLFPGSVEVVNKEVARTCEGVIHIQLRGGDHWTTTITNGEVSVTKGKPTRAGFHTIADPATLLLASTGRTSQVTAALTGKIIGYGRNMGLGLRSRNLFHQL